jgi:hypothetical protein
MANLIQCHSIHRAYRFFLVNAAHVMILGVVWNRKQSGNGDQSRELSAIEASMRVLDFCGQRNAFARKYGSLIKDLRQHLDRGSLNEGGDREYSSSASSANFMNLGQIQASLLASSQPFTESGSTPERQAVRVAGHPDHQSRASRSSLSSEDMMQIYDPSHGPLDARIKSWSEKFGVFYPTNDLSPYGTLLWRLRMNNMH